MANTTNYNWETPDDTDLVKDGAAAIRTLGNSIDTTTKNLNPETTTGDIAYRSATANTNTRLPIGSTGQVLTVAAGVPSWATPTTGDIEGVTAGTGISGGGTSGTVTITNSMATAIDAKGDLVAGTGADAFSRLAVGSNNTVLTADSAEATGLKWAAPAAASFSGALCKKSTSQTISNSTLTAVTWNSEVYDTDNIHSTVTNTDRFTIPAGKGGYWYISVFLNWNNMTTGTRRIYINKNGSEQLTARNDAATTQNWDMTANGVISCAAADYLSVDVFQTSGGNLDIWGDNLGNPVSWISVAYLGA